MACAARKRIDRRQERGALLSLRHPFGKDHQFVHLGWHILPNFPPVVFEVSKADAMHGPILVFALWV